MIEVVKNYHNYDNTNISVISICNQTKNKNPCHLRGKRIENFFFLIFFNFFVIKFKKMQIFDLKISKTMVDAVSPNKT